MFSYAAPDSGTRGSLAEQWYLAYLYTVASILLAVNAIYLVDFLAAVLYADKGMEEIKSCVPAEMNPPLKPMLITNSEGLFYLRDFFNRVHEMGMDTETNITATFYDRRCRTIQVGNKDEQYVIDLLAFAGSKEQLVFLQGDYGVRIPGSPLEEVVDTIREAFQSPSWTKVGANLQFDYEVLKWNFGIRTCGMYDIQLAEKIIYTGAIGFFESGVWALDDLVRRYCGLEIDKSHQKSFDLSTPLTQSQIDYCGLDGRLPLAVKKGQEAKLVKGKLERVTRLENAAIGAFGDMRLNGLLIDKDKWMGLVRDVERKHKVIVKYLDKHFSCVVGNKKAPDLEELKTLEQRWRDESDKQVRAEHRKCYMESQKALTQWKKESATWEGDAAINYSSNAQLLAALRKMGYTKTALKSTNDQDLKQHAAHQKWDVATVFEDEGLNLLDQCDLFDLIRLYRETSKVMSTYGEEFLAKHIHPVTGRVHSTISQLGAETGRTSSSKPNVQNILKGADWRGCFVARPGYKIITVDYSGCELRILAEVSGEKIWIEAFNHGDDVHSVGAEILFGDEWKNGAEHGCKYYKVVDGRAQHQKCSCKTHKKLRGIIKNINFGLAYGMEAKKLAEDLGITKKEAQALLDKYRATFPTVTEYLRQSGQSGLMNLEARTLAGRRRLFEQPTWEMAVKKTQELFKRLKLTPSQEEFSKKVNMTFKGMYGSIEREAKNTPIQGTNADMAKLAMGAEITEDGFQYMWHRLETEFGALLINFVHDEFVVEVPEDKAEACFHFVGECMKMAGAEFVKSVVMDYEGHIDTKWRKE